MSCVDGKCSATVCTSDGQPCASDGQCCSASCAGATCAILNPNAGCRTAGNACTDGSQCCSTLCENGYCNLAASFCIQTGDACMNAGDCCGGVCTIAAGAKLGVCGRPAGGGTYCTGLDGETCGACNECCSRLCAPFGPTGVNVCQPASGCRVNGDLCRKDGDCCGAAGTGLPGDGNVTCEKEPGADIGICRNPRGCNPEANVCHYKDYVCGGSSARNDCCAAVGNSGVCQLDTLGVPRCYGLGTACRNPGETCAMASDCCDNIPCIPDAAGVLRCAIPPDGGGPVCSPQGGPCTINADCCVGLLCIEQAGSTQGVCGIYTPPPPIGDGGTVPPSDAAPPGDGGPLYCALYGQGCQTQNDCCNGVQCTNMSGVTCGPGELGCICYQPLK
jgi:hypothetical protein